MANSTSVIKQRPLERNVLISQLANYNIPNYILEKIAVKCNSELIKKGKLEKILSSMNEPALALLHRIFINCEDGEEGEFSDYRFEVFVSSKVSSMLTFNQTVTGSSGVAHRIKVAAFGIHGLIAVGENKSKGPKVSVEELLQFNEMVKDISRSKDGQGLAYAFYGSSVGYHKEFSKAFLDNRQTKSPANRYGYSIPKRITLLEFRNKNTNQLFSAPF